MRKLSLQFAVPFCRSHSILIAEVANKKRSCKLASILTYLYYPWQIVFQTILSAYIPRNIYLTVLQTMKLSKCGTYLLTNDESIKLEISILFFLRAPLKQFAPHISICKNIIALKTVKEQHLIIATYNTIVPCQFDMSYIFWTGFCQEILHTPLQKQNFFVKRRIEILFLKQTFNKSS